MPYETDVNDCYENDLRLDCGVGENALDDVRSSPLDDDGESPQASVIEELADSDARDGCGTTRQVDGSHGCRTCAERDSAFPSWSLEQVREVLAACSDLPEGIREAVATLIESSGG